MGSCGLIILPMIMLLTITFMNNSKNEIIGGVYCYPIQAPNLTNCVLATDQSVLGPFLNLTFDCCVKVPNTSHSLDFSWDLKQAGVNASGNVTMQVGHHIFDIYTSSIHNIF